MPIKIEIPDSLLPSSKPLIISIATEAAKKLILAESEWVALKPVLKALNVDPNDILDGLTIADAKHSISGNGQKVQTGLQYDKTWSWASKAKFVLQLKGPLTASQIVDSIINEYEPDLTREKAQNSLPATLSMDAAKGRFKRKTNDKGQTVYYL